MSPALARLRDYDLRRVPKEDRFIPRGMVMDALLLHSYPPSPTAVACVAASFLSGRYLGMTVADPCPKCGRWKQTEGRETCDGCGYKK